MDSILFDQVTFAYEDLPVLSSVSFSVQDKEYIGLIGPNGGGKTTLLKLIMGFLTPLRGKIQVLGKSPEEAQKYIAYVPQIMRFDRDFPISVLEVVLSGRLSHLPWYGRFSKEDMTAALEALEKVGLSAFKEHAFGTLSGGQMQRTLIARAIVSTPTILLLDEPTANVDVQAEADIYRIIKELNEEMTILMVTHDLQTVIDQVERVLCVQNSVVSLEPKDVCNHFAIGLYHTPTIPRTQEL